MKLQVAKAIFLFILFYVTTNIGNPVYAQSILSRQVSIHVINQPLGKVMAILAEKGKFGFSFDSKTVRRDSVVNLSAENITIKEALDLLFKNQFEYKETENFVILRYAPLHIALLIEKAWGDNDNYTISGYVTEKESGKRLYQASVYGKDFAKGILTDENGYFEIRLHNIYQPITLIATKENYKDATSVFLKEVRVRQTENKKNDYSILDFDNISRDGVAQFLTSTQQQIQSLNLPAVISQAPYQLSLTPALNTHGAFSGQVVNQVSLNVLGGYSAGVDGVEVGVFFNINKMNMNGVQLAGLFNIAGGSVTGVQLSGLYSHVSYNKTGVQLTGIKNDIGGSSNGLQIAGLLNTVKKNASGVQIAGLFNKVSGNASGVQLAGISNRADTSAGFQFGLINIANFSTGYSFGLLNFMGNGFNKVSIGYNETIDINVALKTGTNRLYTIWLVGMNLKQDSKLYAFGMGMGAATRLTSWLALNPELSCRYLYQGDWKSTNLLNRLDLNLAVKLSKALTITTGPSANIYYSNQDVAKSDYAFIQNRSDSFHLNNSKLRGWVGWGAAVTIF